tara:strand:+ start:1060 stop:1644 length:585 start_codon:yes stop_codon:yes gene_type:complete
MLKFNKIIKIIINLQLIIISTFIPVYLTIPITNKNPISLEFPITWQVPVIIITTLIFSSKIVIKAFSLYLIMGIFFIPVFHHGGSLGYLLTANFGYLLGIYPLIIIIDKLNQNNRKIYYYDLLKYGILGISSMHIIGIIYSCMQTILYRKSEILLYSVAKYSLGNFGFHLLMLTPIILMIKLINNNNYRKNVKN